MDFFTNPHPMTRFSFYTFHPNDSPEFRSIYHGLAEFGAGSHTMANPPDRLPAIRAALAQLLGLQESQIEDLQGLADSTTLDGDPYPSAAHILARSQAYQRGEGGLSHHTLPTVFSTEAAGSDSTAVRLWFYPFAVPSP
jgi:hypothetical protein